MCEGLCYLALSDSEPGSPYLDQAIHFLRKAKDIRKEFDLPRNDTIPFFLAMSYMIQNKHADAEPLLQDISSESDYYQHASHYLDQCSE